MPTRSAGLRERIRRSTRVDQVQRRVRRGLIRTEPPTDAGAADLHHGVDPRVVAQLDGLKWLEGPELELSGWAYLEGVPTTAADTIVVELLDPSSGRVFRIPAPRESDPEVNAHSADKVDHAGAGFRVRLTMADVLAQATPTTETAVRLAVQAEFTTSDGTYRTRLLSRSQGGSAEALRTTSVDGIHVQPLWSAAKGLELLAVVHPVTARGLEIDPTGTVLDLHVRDGFGPTEAALSGERRAPVAALETTDDPSRYRVRLDAPKRQSKQPGGDWWLSVRDAAGREEAVHWAGTAPQPDVALGAGYRLHCAADSRVLVSCTPDVLLIDRISCGAGPELHLEIRGRVLDSRRRIEGLEVADGRRQAVTEEFHQSEGGEFRALLPLMMPGWDGVRRPLPSGTYVLSARSKFGARAQLTPATAAALGHTTYGPEANVRLLRSADQLTVEVSPPLAAEEIGRYHQSVLRATHARRSGPLEGTYLESWFGRSVSDNPLALYDAMRQRGLGAPHTWGVKDLSVAVPDGSRSAVVGSRAWWEALTGAQLVIINHWQRRGMFARRPGQVVVQTWHGTPFKLLGLDRPTKSGQQRAIRIVRRGTGVWDHLISQNPHTSEVFRSAYLWDRPILEVGYPRNDILAVAGGADRAAIRERLDIGPSDVVVLYAPTWREDNRAQVGVLDVPALARELGAGYRVLVRGHTITARRGVRIEAPTVIDVTTYPDPTDLMVAADLLVTDYSSIMFDFSVTGRPILFYVPDLDEYTGQDSTTGSARARGAYFDLSEQAPGPLLASQPQLVRAIRDVRAVHDRFAVAYREWQSRYNPHDDGSASDRVLAVLFPDHDAPAAPEGPRTSDAPARANDQRSGPAGRR